MGDLDNYLGMEIHRDRAKGVLTLTQSTYTHKMPMDSIAVYTINTEGQADEATVKDYRAMIGSLLYLVVYSRPDILYAVVKLSQFCTNLSLIHLAAVKRIFRYLRSYPDPAFRIDDTDAGIVAAFLTKSPMT